MNLTVEAAWYGVIPVRARGRVDGRVKLACLLAILLVLLPVRTGSLDSEPAALLAEADRRMTELKGGRISISVNSEEVFADRLE